MRWSGQTARTEEERKLQGFGRKPEGKRPFGKPRRRWEDGIKMDFRETSWGSVEWIQLAQVRDRWLSLVNTVMNLRVLTPRIYLVIIKPITAKH
jgi:hypothetical protein